MTQKQLRALKEIVDKLPDIPQTTRHGIILRDRKGPLLVNKLLFFTVLHKQGKTGQESVDIWNRKHKATLEKIANANAPK